MIRLVKLELRNFKNVAHGAMEFPNPKDSASIVGVYGQNGSGKTAAVEALACLKSLLAGERLGDHVKDYIAAGKQSACIEATWLMGPSAFNVFSRITKMGKPLGNMTSSGAEVRYSVQIARMAEGARVAEETIACNIDGWRTERVLLAHKADGKEEGAVLDSSGKTERTFLSPAPDSAFAGMSTEVPDMAAIGFRLLPATKWSSLKAIGKNTKRLLETAELVSFASGRSLAFSQEFIQLVASIGAASEEAAGSSGLSAAAEAALEEVLEPLYAMLVALRRYAVSKFYVETTLRSNAVAFDALLVDQLPHGRQDFLPQTSIALQIDAENVIDLKALDELEYTVEAENMVLGQLIPGFQLSVRRLGRTVSKTGGEAERVVLMSVRNGVEVPLRCESEGVRKLVVVLGMLIVAYNDDEACVVIDELDASIFEFLLGELIEALSRHGKGQLIFTAHNLRPMETLPYRSIIVTTVSPDHRYDRLHGVGPTNNLRTTYLRNVNLGSEKWDVYEPTDVLGISGAFYDAAHPFEGDFDSLLDSLSGKEG